jgi:hypothetical protein
MIGANFPLPPYDSLKPLQQRLPPQLRKFNKSLAVPERSFFCFWADA